MPTNSRVFLKPFIGGLNTEASDTDDMVLNTSDELNCTILPEQMRGRRYGFNIEKDGEWIDSHEEITAHSLYHWNNVYGNSNYIVVQINKHLYIYPDIKPHSQQQLLADINLSQYTTLSLVEPVSMTSVSSSLFVVGKWIKPLVIEADYETSTFQVSVNNPKFRDFNGVDDGYAVDYLPTEMTNRHLYNLMNQGWDKTIYDPANNTTHTLLPDGNSYEGLFFTDYAAKYGVGRYPANNLQWFVGKQNSGEYNTTDVLNTYFGNTPAPKGHFIIDYLNRDRSAVSGIELDDEPVEIGKQYQTVLPVNNSEGWTMYALFRGGVLSDPSVTEPLINIPLNYKIRYALPTGISGVLTQYTWSIEDDCTDGNIATKYIRQNVENLDRSNANIVNSYIFSQPFKVALIGVTSNGTEVEIDSQVLQMSGKVFSQSTWNFTVTNSTSFARYEIQITWPSLDRSHKWLVPDTLKETLSVEEINYDSQDDENYEGLPSSDLLKGAITDIESFGGRLFYLCGNTVLFSQTLSTNNKNFDKCYQEADPTSEEVSDILATDGGMIQLLSLGRGKALKRFYRGVLVFGDEEVTGILSNSIDLFTAESYDVVKITSAGLTSKYSVVETDSNVFYWSNHGIYMVGIDENNNISSVCISLNTIQNWYNNLPQFARDNCVGYYDYANNRIYWFYPTTAVADKLDGCLVYDLTFNCFMPQYVDSGKVVRDVNGNYEGILSTYNNYVTRNGKEYKCTVVNNLVYNDSGEFMGYIQDKYLTDCQESSSVYEIEPTTYLRANGNRVVADGNKVLATSTKDAGFNRKSAGLFLISDGTNYSFGDFNDREFRDWDVSPYVSYLVSRPITLGDTYWNKQTPVMQTLFKRTEEYELLNNSLTLSGVVTMSTADGGSNWNGSISIPKDIEIVGVLSTVNMYWEEEGPDGWFADLGYTNMGYERVSSSNPITEHTPLLQSNTGTINCHLWNVVNIVTDPDRVVGMPKSVTISYTIIYNTEENIKQPAQYTTPSGAIIRMRWGWSLNPLSNRWDMMQNGYRPQKDFLHDDYVESRLHIRGRGKAFQIEIRNEDNKDFRLTGLNIITRSPQ